MDLARGSHLHRDVHAAPLRATQPRAREKIGGPKSFFLVGFAHKGYFHT